MAQDHEISAVSLVRSADPISRRSQRRLRRMATDMALDSARPIVSCLVGALAAFSYPTGHTAGALARTGALNDDLT